MIEESLLRGRNTKAMGVNGAIRGVSSEAPRI
jgi:hypothetical protein